MSIILSTLHDLHLTSMKEEIETGRQYLLDKTTLVKVLKPVTRSKTIFNIETPNGSILSVEKNRLSEIHNSNDKSIL